MFAGISLFVGAFQIFNTFSITVAQRTREFGMLRTLGASRGQILSSVGIEALVLGLLGAVGGLAAGILFAAGINALFKAIGADLPNTGTVVLARTVIVSLLIGVVVTLVAALAPALRATRITPMAALRESELQDSKPRGRLTLIAALLLGGLGLALMLIGLFGGIEESGTAAGLLGGGAALILFATSLFSPRLVRPLASLAGKPMERVRGLTGRLARENAMRKPGRTATTAAALMIGLALVTFVTVFAAGLKSSIANTIDENFKSDVILQNTDGFSPIPARRCGRRARRGRRRQRFRRSPTDRASTRASRSASPGSTRRRSTASCRSTSWRARPRSCAGSTTARPWPTRRGPTRRGSRWATP